MFFTPNNAGRNVQSHWNDLWANRNMASTQEQAMLAMHANSMTPEMRTNAAEGFARDFWQEVDRQVVTLREEAVGMEILNDLMSIQTTLPVGKTVRLYNKVGNIAEDVSVTMDGQAPYSFDHTDYDSDGDPIPVFSAGYGVNWRHAAGLSTVGLDLVLDSQEAKLKVYNEKLVSYALDGSAKITVDGKAGQGLRNHRNTKKINLGSGGENVNLTTADAAAIISFFSSGAFGTTARSNRVSQYDVLWVSPEVYANMIKPYVQSGVVVGTVMSFVLPFIPVGEIRQTYALSGNEFLGYERTRSSLSPLIGMTTGTIALPRPLPNSNYNFQILGAMGMQVKTDADGRGGVIYGADLD